MSAHAVAIEALAQTVREFLRDPHKKMLHIVASTELRKGALATVMAAEHAADNFAPFYGFEQAHGAESPGWAARSAAARAQHAARSEGADPPIPPLPPPPPGDDARVGFAQQLWQLTEARPPGTEGMVVVLAPKTVQAPKNWAEGVGLIVGGRRLADTRWVVIDVEGSTVTPVVAGLGGRAMQHDARLPEGAAGAQLGDLIAGQTGAAPRGVTPPPRPDVPSGPMPPEQQTRAEVGKKALAAALALGEGKPTEAVAAQRQARDLCANAGLGTEALQMEMVLGGHLMAAGQGKAAEESFARAIDGARKAEAPREVATSGIALGAARMARREPHTALVAYAEAALAAEQTGEPILAIEGNRLAGQTAADLKMEPQAITFFSRAVKIAETTPPERLSSSTAPHACLGLAKICRKRGLRDRARELEAQAERYAKPIAPPEAPAPEPMPLPLPTLELEPEPEPEPEPAEPTAEAEPAPAEPEPTAEPTGEPELPTAPAGPLHFDVPANPEPAAEPAPPPPPLLARTPEAPAFVDPSEFLGPLPVPPEHIHSLPENSALLRRDALMAAYVPPAEGTILLDDLHPASAPAGPAMAADGTILIDDLPAAGFPAPIAGDDGEGTSMLTLEEIADLHWGGVAPSAETSAEDSRSWTRGEIETLQKAVDAALLPEATLMMSHDELAALRGEKVPHAKRPEPKAAAGELVVDGLEAPPPLAPVPPPDVPDGLEPIPGLEPLPASEASPAASRDKAERKLDGDEVTSLTLADIAKIRDAMRRQKDEKDNKDEEGGDGS